MNSLDNDEFTEIRKACIAVIFLICLCIATILWASSCKKQFEETPQKWHVGDKVKLNGIDPRKSFIPYDCCTCTPCIVDIVYTKDDNYHWYYAIHDTRDSTLVNLTNDALKRY